MSVGIRALVIAVVAGLAGCGSASSEGCSSQRLPVLSSEGTAYRCAASEDCPRPSNVSLCVTDVVNVTQEECIRCEDTQCVRITPEAC